MKTITLATDNFDTLNSFNINNGRSIVKAVLRRDYEKKGDGIYWALASGACLKSSYSEADIAERERLNSEDPLEHGDEVMIDGAVFIVRVKGSYSDCAIFDKAQ